MTAVATALDALALDATQLAGATTANQQWRQIRAAFLRAALVSHPDKPGGSEEAFRAVHEAFEALKARTRAGAVVLNVAASHKEAAAAPSQRARAGGYNPYAAAASAAYSHIADDKEPGYRVERAKTGRSTCIVCNNAIDEGELRFGSLDNVTGGYGRWAHKECFRVPSAVHAFLPVQLAPEAVRAALCALEGLSLTGVLALSDTELDALVEQVSTRARWAKTTAKKKRALAEAKAAIAAKALKRDASTQTDAEVHAVVGEALALPPRAPPIASGSDALKAKSFVLTGVFDEVEGGVGMAKGKGGLEAMIADAGGKVVSAVSKKTFAVIVGRLPGAGKVTKAQQLGVKMLTLEQLRALIAGDKGAADTSLVDTSRLTFSKGFGGNGVAVKRLMA